MIEPTMQVIPVVVLVGLVATALLEVETRSGVDVVPVFVNILLAAVVCDADAVEDIAREVVGTMLLSREVGANKMNTRDSCGFHDLRDVLDLDKAARDHL